MNYAIWLVQQIMRMYSGYRDYLSAMLRIQKHSDVNAKQEGYNAVMNATAKQLCMTKVQENIALTS